MICANRDIIILNKLIDSEERREVYVPTNISYASIYDKKTASGSGSYYSETESYMMRIPRCSSFQNGRFFVPFPVYDAMTLEEKMGFWTIHNSDLIIVCAESFDDINTSAFETVPVTTEQAEEIAASISPYKNLIRVVSFADNTLRGSQTVRHWRIGGA